jgi:hypothetical protein
LNKPHFYSPKTISHEKSIDTCPYPVDHGFVMSCGKGGETPADVVKAFTKKVENGDAAAKDYFSKELAAMFEDEKFKQAMDEKDTGNER